MNKEIVWIEDDIGIIKDVVQPMINDGVKFTFYKSINEANKNIDRLHGADLILLDLIFPPGENSEEEDYGFYPGIPFLEKIRKDFAVETPVIVFTVVTSDEGISRLNKLGVSEILNKPIRPSQLKEAIYESIGESTS